MSENDKINTELFLSFCPRVREICMPLYVFLSIGYFRMVRSYADGSKFTLCSDDLWLRKYFEESIYNLENSNFHRMPKKAKGLSVHGSCQLDHPICNFLNKLSKSCDYNYILTIYEKNDKYIDLFDFGVTGEAHLVHNIFLNNQNLFRKFIDSFIEQGEDMLKKAYENRFVVDTSIPFEMKDNWMIGLSREHIRTVNDNIPLTKLYLDDFIDGTYITATEAKIIYYLIRGLEDKEIIQKLEIDKKYFNQNKDSILKKFNIKKTNDLKKEVFRRELFPRIRIFAGI